MSAQDFRAPWPIRHAQVQSILATKSPRRRLWLKRGSQMEAVAQHHLLDGGDGVRLSGYHSQQAAGIEVRGLAVLIHGWEGSHESSYLYSMACTLYGAGYNVFRLNLRDHGGTHHLNRELFHSARIGEVLNAIHAVRRLDTTPAWFVLGFSLGGNFALRVGTQGPAQNLRPNLALGICPSINPGATLHAIDTGPSLFRWYFQKKWRRTVAIKQAAFPDLQLSNLLRPKNLYETTAVFVDEHTEFDSLQDYLEAYTLTHQQLQQAAAPLAILTAQDDPVVPYDDFHGLRSGGSLISLQTPECGGHCGFIENLGMSSWAEKQTLALLLQARGH
jgi:predicted alpha/beta-fold hydrolase